MVGRRRFKYRYAPALGDGFALATNATLDSTLLAGDDDDYDDITEVAVTRFRSDGA